MRCDVGVVDGKKLNAVIHRLGVLCWHDFHAELTDFLICLKFVLMPEKKAESDFLLM
jgi:hypothetical protein